MVGVSSPHGGSVHGVRGSVYAVDSTAQGMGPSVRSGGVNDAWSENVLTGVRGKRSIALFAEVLAPLTAVVVLVWLGDLLPDARRACNMGICLISLGHGTMVFVLRGAGRITASGLFAYASALIIGYGGAQVVIDPYFLKSPTPQVHLAVALASAVSGQLLIGYFSAVPEIESFSTRVHLSDMDARRLVFWGFGGLILLLMLDRSLSFLVQFRSGMAFTFALMLCAGSLLASRRTGIVGMLLGVLMPVVMFVTLFHDGTGRLRVVGLLCSIALVATLRYRRTWFKIVAVGVTPLALWWFSVSRLALEWNITGRVRASGDGLASMLSSIGVFADLIYAQQEGLGLGFGRSFVTPLFVPVPLEWRPAWVPEPLGYELVKIVAPDRVGTGYSTVASMYGEWWWNFSALGIVVGIGVVSILLRALDKHVLGALSGAMSGSSRAALALVFWAMMIGNIGDLVWSGVHTWIARMYARSVPLLAAMIGSLFTQGMNRSHGNLWPLFGQGVKQQRLWDSRKVAC